MSKKLKIRISNFEIRNKSAFIKTTADKNTGLNMDSRSFDSLDYARDRSAQDRLRGNDRDISRRLVLRGRRRRLCRHLRQALQNKFPQSLSSISRCAR